MGNHTFWIDLEHGAILCVQGAYVILRDASGTYHTGSAFENVVSGEPGEWTTDESSGASLLGLACPVVQALILACETDRVSKVDSEGGDRVIEWHSPPSKMWKWSPDQQNHVQVDTSQRFVFHLSAEGRVLSWQIVVEQPDRIEGPVHDYNYERAVEIGGMSVPRYWDVQGKGRTRAEPGVLELQTAELVDSAPEGAFTREGALEVARKIAQPMVEAERNSFRWYGGPEGEAQAAKDAKDTPFVDPTRKPAGPSWSTAFITGGVVVLALGGFAWWRSRR